MVYFLYNTAVSLAAPLGALWLMAHRKHRRLLARFKPPIPTLGAERPIWVQACSVGETSTARQFIAAARQRWPAIPVLMTVSTSAGYDLAQAACRDIPLTWFPFDHPRCVRRFLRETNPRALVLIETEIWPNVIRETRRFGAPVVIVNGRLSDRYARRYRSFRRVLRPVAANLSAAGMQNEEYAERLRMLGADPNAVHVTGNTKFDGVVTEVDTGVLDRARAENGFDADAPVLIFGSTRPGDEALAARCWETLRREFPALRLVVAPRHADRLREAVAPFHEPVLRRSEVRDGRRPSGERVFFLDTVGELIAFYALATVAVIGGSFYPGVNGHNPLESAALQIPTVFGPYMRNFVDPARELLTRGGAIQVQRPEDLAAVLSRLLADPRERARIAAQGRAAVLANQGAVSRSLDLLETVLPKVG